MGTEKEENLLIHGGRVYTMDAVDSRADAVLLRAGRIVAVGSRGDLEAQAPAGTRRWDVQGASVLPGLIDTHPHLLHYGALEEPLVPLWDCRNHAEIVARIAERAGTEPAGEWVQATPVGEPHFFHRRSYKDLEEGVLPDRHVLDRASTAHPVIIQAWAPVRPSCMALNSLALQRLGITRDTPERMGNVWIEKDADGEPTGRITGSVINYYSGEPEAERLWQQIPFLQFDRVVPGVQSAIGRYHRQGVTAAYENHMMEEVLIEAYRLLRREGALEMRILASQEAESYGMPWSQPRELPEFTERMACAAASIELEDPLFRFNGLTLMWDGYCYGGGQRMRAPYLDAYGRLTDGHRYITEEKAERVMRFCAERRLRLNVLAMGTRAHDEVLAMLEPLAERYDLVSLQWVLVHATTLEPAQLARYRRLGFCATTSMTFCWGEGELIRRSMGQRALADLVPLRRYFDAGMPVAGATDWGPKNVWAQLQLALTHEFGESGYRNLGPAQRISRLEALAMLTRNAAQVMRWEDIGSLQPGHHADLVVVDRDPVECPVEELGETKVLATLFGGRTVFDAGAL